MHSALDSNEQTILVNWYNSLTNKAVDFIWTVEDDLCGQIGVTCDNSSPNQRIISLNLESKGLIGTISTQFGNISYLQEITLSKNQLSGTIPTEIKNLINLQNLDLSENVLTGTIPIELGSLINLQYIGLNSNILSSTIPTKFGSLVNLRYLSLSYNGIIGPIPSELGSLPNLESLSLNMNQLYGTLPSQLGNLGGLTQLDLSGNELSGAIPSQFSTLHSLEKLDLQQNRLTGAIPSFVLILPSLTNLYLQGNYWDCPLFNYSSSDYIHDYNNAENQCDLSCDPNPCLLEQTCSTRFNGDYSCCSVGYYGDSCENAIYCSSLLSQGNAEWDQTLANDEIVNGHCLSGYFGSISRVCIQSDSIGNWGAILGSCDAVYCSSITNEGNAKWNKTLANGQTVSGSCIYGYYGSISRTCTQSGSNGNWDSITGSCLAINCPYISNEGNAEWDETLAIGQIANGNCLNGYSGTVSRTCSLSDLNGNWSSITGSCNDIDECLTNNGGCDKHAICTNTQGSFTCSCEDGYSGDGIICNDSSKSEKNQSNNQAVGIGVGVSFGFLGLVGLILLVLFFIRKKKIKEKESKNQESVHLEMADLESVATKTFIAGDMTLMNTKFEISLPGFMNIDFVNQIRKEEKIGGGGAAIIYKGVIVDPKLREKFGFKEVAIKQLVDDHNVSLEESTLRFEQEISIIWSISSHPNTLILVGYSENPPSIITKLYDEDLYHYVQNSKKDIPSEIIFQFAKDIASGMSLIHSNGIAHRDLKSSNILLEKENGKMKAIICDFGLARISSEKNILNQKLVNVRGLSPRYTAPEVFGRMMTNVTIVSVEEEMKSDVYSYSLILWEMMTRKIPWSNLKETTEIDFQVRSGKREPIPDSHEDSILVLLSALIEICWNQVPLERPTFNQIYQKLSSSIY